MSGAEDCSKLASHWCAAGIRHAVLLRVLPALRHDLATPISVVRMTALVLQRKLAAPPIDVDYCTQRVQALDQQTDALSDVLRLLLGWSVGAGDSDVSRSALVQGCVKLLRPMWATRGMLIEVDAALQPPDPAMATAAAELRWPGEVALRYLLLGALCHLQDTAAGAAQIHILPQGSDALRLQRLARASGNAAWHGIAGLGAEQPIAIDAAALECLAADLGYRVQIGTDDVCVRLAKNAGRPHAVAAPVA